MVYSYMTWEEVEKACNNIHKAMIQKNYVPDIIVGLLWGGIVPTRLLVDLMGHKRLNTHVMYTSLYDGTKKRDNVEIKHQFSKEDLNNKKVLIVDDIWDTGETMKAVLQELLEHNCMVSTATLVYKNSNSSIAPTFYDKIVERDDVWTVFPWEKHEFFREIKKKVI